MVARYVYVRSWWFNLTFLVKRISNGILIFSSQIRGDGGDAFLAVGLMGRCKLPNI